MSDTPRSSRIRTRSDSKRSSRRERGRGRSTLEQVGDGAAVEHRDAVGEQDRLLDVVRDEHDREAALLHRPTTRACIRSRVSASSAPNGSSSSSTAGSRVSARASATRWASPPESVAGHASAWCLEADVAQRGERAGAALGPAPGDPEDDVLPDPRPGQQAGVLEAEGDAAVDVDGAVVAVVEAADGAQQRALAAAALADDDEDLARLDLEVDAGEHGSRAEAAADLAGGDGGAHTNSSRQGRERRSISRTIPSISSPSRA